MPETEVSIEKVAVFESTITLPTYIIQGQNPNPVFRSQYGVVHIYPYTLLDDIASSPTDRTYRTLVLENRYLRVTVIPDLGGRVYSVFDKVSQREVFYKNDVVKFSPLAIRGAFFSGGVEFSFPVAHAPTTADPINWNIRQKEDGSASISFGAIEHISRLRWMITLTLYPELCALAQDVQLYNPYRIPGRYHYWTNASLDADDQTEFIYPLRRARSYEFAGTASWPFSRLDLILKDPGLPGMEGVPMWPAERMQEPVNFRWQKNMLAQVSVFGRDVTWDFFGAWQHSGNHGYAHFADHRDVGGMKLWSWGNAGVGVVNQTALTDDGSVYAETQCGAMETQLDFAFLPPARTRLWREWWLPLRGINGLTCASAELGARLHLGSARQVGNVTLSVGLCPARDLGQAHLELSIPGKTLLDEIIPLAPERPCYVNRSVPARELADYPLRLRVTDQSGQVVMDTTLDRDANPVDPVSPDGNSMTSTAEEFCQLGLKFENFDNREQALAAYRKALELDPEDGKAHYQLGLMLLRAADFSAAKSHFHEAVGQGLGEANYFLGLVGVYEGEVHVARQHFQSVPKESPLAPAALLELGCLELRQKDWQKAAGLFKQAYPLEARPVSASLLLGIALQRAGQAADARREFEYVLSVDPLNHAALREMAHMLGNPYKQTFNRLLADDPQYWLDLAAYYLDIGLLEDTLPIPEDVYPTWPYPMLAYLAGYVCHSLGRKEEARAWLEKAAVGRPEFVFPSRLEEVVALQYALKQNPQDFKAKYYLGNFMYAHQRFEGGVRLWLEALQGLPEFDILYRNLGIAAWQRDKNLPLAIEHFEKALALNPQNQDLYLHLDDLYKVQGLMEKRRWLLEKINALPHVREDVHKRSIQLLVDLGGYEQALHIMQEQKFIPLEMDQSFHNLYVRALMMRAEERLVAGRIEEAIEDYRKALEYPENLGVGKPTTLSQAHIYYHLGTAYEKLGCFQDALTAWRHAAREHHPHDSELFAYVQMALDKLSRYSELGFEI